VSNIGVVTLHRSSSYGGSLQGFATFIVLKNLNHEVEFINYTNKNEQSQDKWICLRSDRSFLGNIRGAFRNIILLQPYYRQKSYKEFHEKIPVTKKKFFSISEMDRIQYDILLTGSDQLWNPLIFGKLDPVYFLGFGQAKKRIAYAASMGSHQYKDHEAKMAASLLEKYDVISAREEHVAREVKKLTGKQCSVVLDPTLLVSKHAWMDALNIKPQKIGNYILLYLIGVSVDYYKKNYAKIVKFYSKAANLPVYYVSPDYRKVIGADVALKKVTPIELLELILNARFIITSSYHGIAFSINFGRQFVALENPNNPLRVRHLLKSLHIKDQIVDQWTVNYDLPQNKIDFDRVHAELNAQRQVSLHWLKDALT
jgi:hypothetical protein